jgi:hypothetical protein
MEISIRAKRVKVCLLSSKAGQGHGKRKARDVRGLFTIG